MASVKPKAAGVWLMRWRAKDAMTGKPAERSKIFHGVKADAEREANRLEAEQRVTPLRLDRNKTLEGFLRDDWIPWRQRQPDLNERTRRSVLIRCANLLRVASRTRLTEVSGRDLDLVAGALQREGRYANVTIKVHLAELRFALRQAKRWRMIHGEPWLEHTVMEIAPPTPKLITPTDAERMAVILDTYHPTAAAMVRLAAGTGARISELLALRWQDLGPAFSTVFIHRAAWSIPPNAGISDVTKNHASRRILRLPETTRAALARYAVWHQAREAQQPGWAPDGLLFPAHGGGLWTGSLAHRALQSVQRRLGLPTGLHTLRHGHATALLEAGVSVKAVADRLGHGNPATTLKVYAHVTRLSEDAILHTLDRLIAPSSAGVPSGPSGFAEDIPERGIPPAAADLPPALPPPPSPPPFPVADPQAPILVKVGHKQQQATPVVAGYITREELMRREGITDNTVRRRCYPTVRIGGRLLFSPAAVDARNAELDEERLAQVAAKSFWNADRIATLRRLWAAGAGNQQLAAALGTTHHVIMLARYKLRLLRTSAGKPFEGRGGPTDSGPHFGPQRQEKHRRS
jgi:integrase